LRNPFAGPALPTLADVVVEIEKAADLSAASALFRIYRDSLRLNHLGHAAQVRPEPGHPYEQLSMMR
jgi:hypothetical protein